MTITSWNFHRHSSILSPFNIWTSVKIILGRFLKVLEIKWKMILPWEFTIYFFTSAIKNLRNLEVLNFSGNFITEAPDELTECKEIFQLNFDDCFRLFSIPKNIFTLPRLVIASFKKCSLIIIPSVVPSNLISLSIEGNQLLNCVPQEILKFLPPTQSPSDFYMTDQLELETLQKAR